MRAVIVVVMSVVAFAGCDEQAEPVAERLEFSPSPKRSADCATGDPARERYGTDCACCHGSQFATSGSVGAEALPFVRHVEVIDSVGQVFVLPPNAYGNFFRHRPAPVLPLHGKVVFLDGRESTMRDEINDPSCNHCHRVEGAAPMLGARLNGSGP